jgi:hypothetical protein
MFKIWNFDIPFLSDWSCLWFFSIANCPIFLPPSSGGNYVVHFAFGYFVEIRVKTRQLPEASAVIVWWLLLSPLLHAQWQPLHGLGGEAIPDAIRRPRARAWRAGTFAEGVGGGGREWVRVEGAFLVGLHQMQKTTLEQSRSAAPTTLLTFAYFVRWTWLVSTKSNRPPKYFVDRRIFTSIEKMLSVTVNACARQSIDLSAEFAQRGE